MLCAIVIVDAAVDASAMYELDSVLPVYLASNLLTFCATRRNQEIVRANANAGQMESNFRFNGRTAHISFS